MALCYFKLTKLTAIRNITRFLSTDCQQKTVSIAAAVPRLIHLQENVKTSDHVFRFAARSNLNIGPAPSRIPLHIIDIPNVNCVIEMPKSQLQTIDIKDLDIEKSPVELPATETNQEKQAARLIVIRRRKMKKHKLRKLRKKMKFEWAKVRQRRELRKEKAFQAGLIAQIKEAEQFSAEQYVEDKIRQATETPLPRLWKGKRLPQFIIKELIAKQK